MTPTHPTTGFSGLESHQYANLFTYRKSGEAVKTTVWFALGNGKAYVMTTTNAGKLKRIRNGGRVEIGPSDRAGKPLGPTVTASARILDAAETPLAKEALHKKYGFLKTIFDFFRSLSGTDRAFIEIAPTSTLSAPIEPLRD